MNDNTKEWQRLYNDIEEEEPARFYDWILWKMKKDPEWIKNTFRKKSKLTNAEHKEANRLFWVVKGHLIPGEWDDQAIISIYVSYTKRVWTNCEQYIHEEGFEEAYATKYPDGPGKTDINQLDPDSRLWEYDGNGHKIYKIECGFGTKTTYDGGWAYAKLRAHPFFSGMEKGATSER